MRSQEDHPDPPKKQIPATSERASGHPVTSRAFASPGLKVSTAAVWFRLDAEGPEYPADDPCNDFKGVDDLYSELDGYPAKHNCQSRSSYN
jgi:hypothetical protein